MFEVFLNVYTTYAILNDIFITLIEKGHVPIVKLSTNIRNLLNLYFIKGS